MNKVTVGEVYKALSNIVIDTSREHVNEHPLGDRTKRVITLVLEDYMMEVPEELTLKLVSLNLSMVEAAMKKA